MAKTRPAEGPIPLARLIIPLGRRDPRSMVGSRGEEYTSVGGEGLVALLFLEVEGWRRSQYLSILENYLLSRTAETKRDLPIK